MSGFISQQRVTIKISLTWAQRQAKWSIGEKTHKISQRTLLSCKNKLRLNIVDGDELVDNNKKIRAKRGNKTLEIIAQ